MFDVFISHAGPLKDLARDIESDLRRIGWVPFIDIESLQPGSNADKKIIDSARSTPIGLVLFDKNFLYRKWTVKV
jgi:hypothetical protein